MWDTLIWSSDQFHSGLAKLSGYALSTFETAENETTQRETVQHGDYVLKVLTSVALCRTV